MNLHLIHIYVQLCYIYGLVAGRNTNEEEDKETKHAFDERVGAVIGQYANLLHVGCAHRHMQRSLTARLARVGIGSVLQQHRLHTSTKRRVR